MQNDGFLLNTLEISSDTDVVPISEHRTISFPSYDFQIPNIDLLELLMRNIRY